MNRPTLAILLCILHAPLAAETLTAVADPWSPYVTPEIADQGLAAQIVREALKRQGFDLEIRFMPWARALRLAQNGDVDLLVAAWWTQERAGYLHFSEPYAENNLSFIKRKGDPFEFSDLDSLTGKRIGVVRDYGYDDAFLQAGNFQRLESSSFLANMRMLMVGRVDLVLEDQLVAITTLAKEAPQQLEKIQFSQHPLLTKKLFAATGLNHPRHQQIITAINQGLAAMQAEGSPILQHQQAPN